MGKEGGEGKEREGKERKGKEGKEGRKEGKKEKGRRRAVRAEKERVGTGGQSRSHLKTKNKEKSFISCLIEYRNTERKQGIENGQLKQIINKLEKQAETIRSKNLQLETSFTRSLAKEKNYEDIIFELETRLNAVLRSKEDLEIAIQKFDEQKTSERAEMSTTLHSIDENTKTQSSVISTLQQQIYELEDQQESFQREVGRITGKLKEKSKGLKLLPNSSFNTSALSELEHLLDSLLEFTEEDRSKELRSYRHQSFQELPKSCLSNILEESAIEKIENHSSESIKREKFIDMQNSIQDLKNQMNQLVMCYLAKEKRGKASHKVNSNSISHQFTNLVCASGTPTFQGADLSQVSCVDLEAICRSVEEVSSQLDDINAIEVNIAESEGQPAESQSPQFESEGHPQQGKINDVNTIQIAVFKIDQYLKEIFLELWKWEGFLIQLTNLLQEENVEGEYQKETLEEVILEKYHEFTEKKSERMIFLKEKLRGFYRVLHDFAWNSLSSCRDTLMDEEEMQLVQGEMIFHSTADLREKIAYALGGSEF